MRLWLTVLFCIVALAIGSGGSAHANPIICRPPGLYRAAAIMIHGGGWVAGSAAQARVDCQELARRGILIYAVEYPLVPAVTWPAPLETLAAAVKAERRQSRAARFCAIGVSVGGQLALWLGQSINGAPPVVDCVVSISGPGSLNGLSGLALADALRLVGKTWLSGYGEARAALRQGSPITAVSGRSAPALLIQGTRDHVVSPAEAGALEAEYRAADAPVTLLWHRGGHMFADLGAAQRAELWLKIAAFINH
jgi:acetyl esterase/lipase